MTRILAKFLGLEGVTGIDLSVAKYGQWYDFTADQLDADIPLV